LAGGADQRGRVRRSQTARPLSPPHDGGRNNNEAERDHLTGLGDDTRHHVRSDEQGNGHQGAAKEPGLVLEAQERENPEDIEDHQEVADVPEVLP